MACPSVNVAERHVGNDGCLTAGLGWLLLVAGLSWVPAAGADPPRDLTLKSKTLLAEMSPLAGAIYQQASGSQMIKLGGYSSDHGRSWSRLDVRPDFDSPLPYGYRRNPAAPWRDPVNGNILLLLNCMDTAGKDPQQIEPLWQWYWYYLRYRVSIDGGRTFLCDEPIVQEGAPYSAQNPIGGVHVGKNCFFLGDTGCRPLRTRGGTLLIPVQMPPLTPDGTGFYNPGRSWYWLDTVSLRGRWTDDHRLRWDVSQSIQGDSSRTSRGLYEGTLAELADGTILCVMRGSNGGTPDPDFTWPSYKWCSSSTDDGRSWSPPRPWTFTDGEPFFSPSSMSQLFAHSSGRIFWIGNLSPENCRANHPRWPLVIGEVDGHTGALIRDSLLTIDSRQTGEDDINLSHWHLLENRESGDLVVVSARASLGYTSRQPVVYLIGVHAVEGFVPSKASE